MFYYIEITRINGRNDMLNLSARLDARGYEDTVEYWAGGWEDTQLHIIRPHLRFQNEQDAMAYSLTYGGDVLKAPPGSNKDLTIESGIYNRGNLLCLI